jgi:MFS family permease
MTHLVQPWHVYVTAFMAGTVQAFQQPARQTLISDIVGNERLLNALALNSAALNGSRVIGPGISGALIVWLGIANSYYLQGVMYLVATVWTIQMRVPEPHSDRAQRAREPFFQSIRAGFGFVANEPNIRTLIILALGPLTFAMAYTSLMPVIAITVLHGDAITQGMLLSFIGVGALGGALVVASIRREAGYGLPVVIGALMFSGGVFAFATSHVLWLSCLLAVVLGAFNVTYTTQNQALLQVLAPRRIRGRVMSIYLLNRATVPMGALLAGSLASRFGGQTAIHVMAGAAMLIVAIVVATNPSFLRLRVGFTDAEEADREREDAATPGAGSAPASAST